MSEPFGVRRRSEGFDPHDPEVKRLMRDKALAQSQQPGVRARRVMVGRPAQSGLLRIDPDGEAWQSITRATERAADVLARGVADEVNSLATELQASMDYLLERYGSDTP